MALYAFDAYNRREKPAISLCNPSKAQLFPLGKCRETEIKLKWNAQSEFNFLFDRSMDGTVLPAYDYIEGKRYVLVDGIGYFIISEVTETENGIYSVKEVKCLSQESELNYKKVMLFSGTYKFYNPSNPADTTTFLGNILAYAPGWTIGSIDASLVDLYRTFDISDSNVYEVLVSEAATAFGCVFVFGQTDKTISAIPSGATPNPTDIFLSFDNLVKQTDYSEISNELVTCMYCYGNNDLTIRSVNPLGTNTLYDFTHYKSTAWMSQGLINAITAWEDKVDAYETSYGNSVTDLSNYQSDLLSASAVLANYQRELDSDTGVRNARLTQGLSTTDIDAEIATDNANIAAQNVVIAGINGNIAAINAALVEINNLLALTNTANFSAEQYAELTSYIFENTYKNDNITTTDSMTPEQLQEQAQELYDMSQSILAKAAIPRYQITVDAVNFLALKEYIPFIEQLELGDQITVDTGRGYFIDATLLEYDYSYDDPTKFSLVLSNRQRLDDSSFILTDFIGHTIKKSNMISYQSPGWNEWPTVKSTVIGNTNTPAGTLGYGIIGANVKGTIEATNELTVRNINSTTGANNFVLDDTGVVIRDPTIIANGQTGKSRSIYLDDGTYLSFENGILVAGTALNTAVGDFIYEIEDLSGRTGTYFTLSNFYKPGSLELKINGLDQEKGYTYIENINENGTNSFTTYDTIQATDRFIAKYVAL